MIQSEVERVMSVQFAAFFRMLDIVAVSDNVGCVLCGRKGVPGAGIVSDIVVIELCTGCAIGAELQARVNEYGDFANTKIPDWYRP